MGKSVRITKRMQLMRDNKSSAPFHQPLRLLQPLVAREQGSKRALRSTARLTGRAARKTRPLPSSQPQSIQQCALYSDTGCRWACGSRV